MKAGFDVKHRSANFRELAPTLASQGFEVNGQVVDAAVKLWLFAQAATNVTCTV